MVMAEDEDEAAATPAPSKPTGEGTSTMPTKFLGFLDVTTGPGSLAASLVVAAAFGVLVEFVKFVDPNPSSPSVFGSLWS